MPCVNGAADRLARKTLKELRSSTNCTFSGDYEDGFEQAFEDIAEGGKGVLPPVPPSKYWKEKYRCPEGAAKVEEWYSGYHSGVQHAFMKGVQHCNHVRSRQDFIESTLDNGCGCLCGSGAGVTCCENRSRGEIEYEICNQSSCCNRPGGQLIAPGQCGTGCSAGSAPSTLSQPVSPAPQSEAVPTPLAPNPPATSQPTPVPAERPAGPAARMVPQHQQLGYEYELGANQGRLQPISGAQPATVEQRPLSWGTEATGSSQNSRRIDSWLFR